MRKLIIYGNCQSGAVYEVLRRIPAIAERWQVVHHQLWAKGEELERNLADFDTCDILMKQELSNWRTHPKAATLDPAIQVIAYPFCYLAALWPFDGHQNGNDPGWKYLEGEGQFAFTDNLLGRLRTEVPDPVERFHRYRQLDVEGLPDIGRYAELEQARLLREDRRLGYSVGRYIVDHYRTERLFHAITHPARPLLIRLIQEILGKLDIETGDVVPLVLDYLEYFQVPVHPEVARILGLEWVTPDTRSIFHKREMLTWEEYVLRYIRIYG
jgi:hypothetical protein